MNNLIPGDTLTPREIEILERLSAGLTDQQIAADLFLSPNTIRWYNRQIYSKLSVSSRTQAIARAQELGLLGVARAIPITPAPAQMLPVPATPFIGRSTAVADVKRLLRDSRLLTLSGTGGTGKTRLALHILSEVRDQFTDGAYFVDLAPVDDPQRVAETIAAVLGVIENPGQSLPETLQRVLSGREMLLLLDNFEHVIQSAPLVSSLVAASPHLKVMVTSREALKLSGEQDYPVPPLSLPVDDSVQSVTESEAGSLFVQRVQMVQPHFDLSPDNAPVIARICRRLDGLPLALELAAARCKLLTPPALLERLDNRLTLLTAGPRDAPARQRTLRDTLEWSYNLLDDGEKILFARLAVFRGGCSLEAVETVCGPDLPLDTLDGLESLLDKSLLQQKEMPSGEPRFTMLETLHEYAWEQLAASGESETLCQRHAGYFVELAERAEPELRLAQQKRWFQLLETEAENMRAALEWALNSSDATLGVRLAGALSLYWYVYGHHIEGLRWTQQLLPRLDESPEQYQARFLVGAAHMMRVRNLDTTKPLLHRALALSRQLGDTYHTALTLVRLGYITTGEPQALSTAEEGLALFRQMDHQPGIAHALNIIGEIARFNGDDAHAQSAYEEALALCHQTGDTRGILVTFLNLTFIACHQGDYQRARETAHHALALARELDLRAEMAECLIALAAVRGVTGEPHLAARLFGVADVVLERAGAFFDHADRPEFDRMIAAVHAQLDDAAFEASRQEGRAMSLEQATACALQEQPPA